MILIELIKELILIFFIFFSLGRVAKLNSAST